MVRKNQVEARCVLRSHQFGWEVCLQVGLNRDFLQTKVCRTQDEVFTTGEEWKAAMIEKGWQGFSPSARVPKMTERVSRNRWAWRLWLITCLLFLLAAWQQPANRPGSLSLAVVFGIFAVASRSRLNRSA